MATVKSDNSGRIFKAIREALKKEVLVGVPDSSAARPAGAGREGHAAVQRRDRLPDGTRAQPSDAPSAAAVP